MKMQQEFKAERRVALHCTELLRCRIAPSSSLDDFAGVSEALAPTLALALGPVCGSAPSVECGGVEAVSFASLTKMTGSPSCHSVILIGPRAVPMLVSLEATAALLLLDQAFGGNGTRPASVPSPLPASAALMVAQVEAAVARAVSMAFGCPADATSPGMKFDKSACFAPRSVLATAVFNITAANYSAWAIRLTVEQARVADLPCLSGASSKSDGAREDVASGRLSAAFAAIPLTLRAVLVDAEISIAKVAGLQPGVLLPVSLSRSVPLWAEGVEIGRGSVGSLDDTAAIKIRTLHSNIRKS